MSKINSLFWVGFHKVWWIIQTSLWIESDLLSTHIVASQVSEVNISSHTTETIFTACTTSVKLEIIYIFCDKPEMTQCSKNVMFFFLCMPRFCFLSLQCCMKICTFRRHSRLSHSHGGYNDVASGDWRDKLLNTFLNSEGANNGQWGSVRVTYLL